MVHTDWSVAGSADPLRIFGATWSYQPSESSYVTTIAVLDQDFDDSIALISRVRNFCSSSGLE